MSVILKINGESRTVDADPGTPLLWILRDHLAMTGTKFGCGIGQCGCCTVHLNGVAGRSCQMPFEAVVGVEITTIEGLSKNANHPLQKLWLEMNVPQCGYCQAGVLMAASALLARRPKPTDAEIEAAVDNICRCGTYVRIRAAIHRAAEKMQSTG
jgi:isoquinoline 1-oxidoreductase subunit alpha